MTRRREGLIVAGPTGSGKSTLALEIAQAEGGVILNGDSLQLYDALPLLTAQPSSQDQGAVPHFLYGVVSPLSPVCSAGQWCGMIAQLLGLSWSEHPAPTPVLFSHEGTLLERIPPQAMPIVVGGTGFYLQALVKGLSPIPPVPPHILQETQDQSLEHAYGKLDQVDPVTAKRLQPGDTQRIIRALSVWNATGRPLSAWQVLPRVPLPYPFRVHCVLPEKDVLHQRLRSRLNHMVSGGVFEEVRLFMEQLSPKALQTSPVTRALGFREIQKFWEGTMTQREAVERIFQLTRQYAKRQMTWLRHQKWGD